MPRVISIRNLLYPFCTSCFRINRGTYTIQYFWSCENFLFILITQAVSILLLNLNNGVFFTVFLSLLVVVLFVFSLFIINSILIVMRLDVLDTQIKGALYICFSTGVLSPSLPSWTFAITCYICCYQPCYLSSLRTLTMRKRGVFFCLIKLDVDCIFAVPCV